MKYIISLKNGVEFTVIINNFLSFVDEIRSQLISSSRNNFYVVDGMMLNINELSAIYLSENKVYPNTTLVKFPDVDH